MQDALNDFGFDYIDKLPKIKIDFECQKMWVDGLEVKLIKKLVADPKTNSVTVEKYRVFVPEFKFENPWENFFGTDNVASDEAVEDFNKNKSLIILDRASRKPLLYSFLIDEDNNLYFKSKRIE